MCVCRRSHFRWSEENVYDLISSSFTSKDIEIIIILWWTTFVCIACVRWVCVFNVRWSEGRGDGYTLISHATFIFSCRWIPFDGTPAKHCSFLWRKKLLVSIFYESFECKMGNNKHTKLPADQSIENCVNLRRALRTHIIFDVVILVCLRRPTH